MVKILLKWEEPDPGRLTVGLDISAEDAERIRAWAEREAGDEWGLTIPSIEVLPGRARTTYSMRDFASAIRYDTGEEVYRTDGPLFPALGISRS